MYSRIYTHTRVRVSVGASISFSGVGGAACVSVWPPLEREHIARWRWCSTTQHSGSRAFECRLFGSLPSLSPSLSLFFALPLVLHTYIYTYRGQTEARLCCCVAAAQRNSDSIRHFYVDTFNSVETHGARTVAAASLPSLIYRRYGEGTRRRREERAARALRARRRVNNCFRIFPFNLGRR